MFFAIGLVSFGINPTEENEESNAFTNSYISYTVEKEGSIVLINLSINDLSQYELVEVLRSDNPNENFRRVKYLKGSSLNELQGNPTVVDKYPLSGKVDSYYRVSTTDVTGVTRFYPSVQLNK